jgi:hypothetical protein
MTACHWLINMSKHPNFEDEAPRLLQKVTSQLHSDASHPSKMESYAPMLWKHQCSVLY